MKSALLSAQDYAEGILSGNRALLSRAITLTESTRADHQLLAQEIIKICLPHSGNAFRLGITGVPGVGKSTFIEALGLHIINSTRLQVPEQANRLAVLAIDPSSQVSKGSILGDKTRMEQLSAQRDVFIRPSPAGNSLGGVARKTRETIVLCEAAGFSHIIIETVGVGQSEHTVHALSDCFLLLLLPGAGDELQGIKRGIVEMADLLAVNKADGDNAERAALAKQDYARALHLFPPKESTWIPQVHTLSALTGQGIPELWERLLQYEFFTKEKGWWQENRRRQTAFWFQDSLQEQLRLAFFNHEEIKKQLPLIEQLVLNGRLSPFQAASDLVALFKSQF